MKFIPKRILVFSPHPDDELLGCGGFLLKHKQNGAIIKIVLVTQGELFENNISNKIRINEFKSSLKKLDIDDYIILNEKDGNISLSGEIIDHYYKIYKEFLPDTILLPSPFDNHLDHIKVTKGVIKALTGKINGIVNLLFYEVVTPSEINYIENISNFFEIKKNILLSCYSSQLKRYNYQQSIEALALLRGSQIGDKYAEGFLLHKWDGTKENFFPHMPFVSVILRAKNRNFLKHAIFSLLNQIYHHFEVIIVWFGENDIKIEELNKLDVKIIKGKKNRSYNLNLGIKNSDGDYIAFLDEDDYWYKNHLSLLVEKLYSEKNIDIVYSGCNVRNIILKKDKIEIGDIVDIFNEEYTKGRFFFENYIPLISVLIKKNVFKHILFSENLSIYEDWYFFVELEKYSYNFSHINQITCEYRIQGKSLKEVHKKKKYFEEEHIVREKIIEILTPEIIQELANLWKKFYLENKKLKAQIKNILYKNNILTSYIKKLEERENNLISLNNSDITFAIIIVVYNPEINFLQELINSIKNQIYKKWKLYILNNGSDPKITSYLKNLLNIKELKNKTFYLEKNKNIGITNGFNECCKYAEEDYFVLVDHDDYLYPECLFELAIKLKNKNFKFCYTDSYTIDIYGKPIYKHNKPDWSPETILSFNYINHLSVFKKELWKELNGYNNEFEGVQDWDILLRLRKKLKEDEVLHIKKPLYGWRAVRGSVAYKFTEKEWLKEKSKKLWIHHYFLITNNFISEDELEFSEAPGFRFPINYNFQPSINIIIPSKNTNNFLTTCVNSLLNNNYKNFKITVIDTGINNNSLKKYLQKNKIEFLEYNHIFNWSTVNNIAASNSKEDFLLFLNDDVIINDKNFLIKLVQPFMIEKIGIIGALLKFPDNNIQHNGIITDKKYIAYEERDLGLFKEKYILRNVSAVTGACMLVKKDIFDKVNGFDENLPNNYNDVDFCLKVRKINYRVVMFPYAEATHFHMATRGKDNKPEEWEIKYMQKKWDEFLNERYNIKWEKTGESQIILKVEND